MRFASTFSSAASQRRRPGGGDVAPLPQALDLLARRELEASGGALHRLVDGPLDLLPLRLEALPELARVAPDVLRREPGHVGDLGDRLLRPLFGGVEPHERLRPGLLEHLLEVGHGLTPPPPGAWRSCAPSSSAPP